MHRLVPELIEENYLAGKYHGSFEAVGMFLDISGFSAMTDALMQHGQHGAEVLALMMRSVFEPLVRSIFEQGGMIVGFAGDAISALYPVEHSQQESLRHALASAWTIQNYLADNPIHQTVYGSFPITAKIGVGQGKTIWGILTSKNGSKATYYFRGAAVDKSAQAEHHANARDIILTADVYEQMKAEIKAEKHDAFFHLTSIGELPAAHPTHPKPVDPEVMRVFCPEILSSQELRSEFRQVVSLFISLPILSGEKLQEFIYTLFDLQERYDGLIERLDFGDKGCNIMVLWGAPVTYENDIGRALNFILNLQAQAGFPLNVGVTYYISRAGFIGSDLFENYTSYGWGVNLASRFMVGAPDGQIWVDERVVRRVNKRFDFIFVGEQDFKGFTRKQKVYSLLGRKPESESLFQGEMVGRVPELQELRNFISPLRIGQYAGAIIVWGDGGIGKSRLVYEFKVSSVIESQRVLWALCQSDQILRESFNPFRYWLKRYFGLSTIQDDAIAKQYFEAKLQHLISSISEPALAETLNRTRSILGSLLDLYWPDSLYEQLDAQGRHDNTILALVALLKAESLQQPVVIFIEDAHYLDDDSKAFLPYLKRALKAEPESYPVAIIATSRFEGDVEFLETEIADQNLYLNELSPEALSRLAEIVLGNAVAPDLVKVLTDRSEGNPYFAEQFLHYLEEENLLELGDKGWTITPKWQKTVLPADINAVLIARLDQLTSSVRDVIQTAAVLGREFEILILATMLIGDDVFSEVTEAEKASIWSPLSQIRYLFNHALLRDAAYTMQMQARRQELHALAVEAFETLYINEANLHYGELAYHSELAGSAEKARRYLELAGDTARITYQNAQAADYYSRALRITPAGDLADRYRLIQGSEAIFAIQGKRDEWAGSLDELQSLALMLKDLARQSEVAYRQAEYNLVVSEYQNAVDLAKQAISLGRQSGRLDLATQAYRSLADSFSRQGKYLEAVEQGETGLALAREIGHKKAEATILNSLGLIFLSIKEPSVSKINFIQSLEIFRQLGELRGQAQVVNNLGNVSGYVGDFGTAQMYYEQALNLAREIGDRKGEGLVFGNLGWIAGLQGDFKKARFYGEQNLIIARETGDRFVETYGLINLSSHAGALGDLEAAIRFAEQGLELGRQSQDKNAEAWALTYLGHGLFETGQLERCAEVYKTALEIQRGLGQNVLATEPGAGLARAALARGDQAMAQHYVDLIIAHLDEGGTLDGTDQPLRVYLSCYLVLQSMDSSQANALLETAYEMLNVRAASINDETARREFLENTSYHREIVLAWQKQHGMA